MVPAPPGWESVGLANEYPIFFGKFHLDGGNPPQQAPYAALRAAKTGFLLGFSAAARRIKEFVGRGGLHCGGNFE